MIDFQNGLLQKLTPVQNSHFEKNIEPLMIDGENILHSFKNIRDGIVFTNKRIITINFQGVTGKKVDYTSMPYSKIQTFGVETIGFSMDAEIELWFSSLGKVKLEFDKHTDIIALCKTISEFVL